jgi:hypothetical protein
MPDQFDDEARKAWQATDEDNPRAAVETIAALLRKAERRGRVAGLKAAKAIASSFPAHYSDGASLHAENMTAGRISIEISALANRIEKSE